MSERIIVMKRLEARHCAVCGCEDYVGAIDLDLPGYLCDECLPAAVTAENLLLRYCRQPDEALIKRNP